MEDSLLETVRPQAYAMQRQQMDLALYAKFIANFAQTILDIIIDYQCTLLENCKEDLVRYGKLPCIVQIGSWRYRKKGLSRIP